jgi:PAS domain S-box-containing protein
MVSVGRTVPGVKTVLRGLAVLFCLALGGPPFTSLRAAESTTVASGPRRVSLQLTRRHQIQFAGFYMAQELGYYREASLTGWLYAVRHMDETVARVQGSYATGADLSGPVDVLLGSTLQRIGSEQAVRESESLLRSAAEGAIDGIALMAQDGRYLLVNARFAAMYGCPVAAMVGRHFSEFVPPEERDDKLRRFARRVQGDHKEIEYESRLQRKDGTFLPIRLTVSNVAWRGQRVFAIVLRDLSESKRLEQELLHIGEWERIRIGQDLHDTIGQQLAGMAYLIEVLARNLGREPSAHAREAKEIAQVAGTAHAQLRDVVQSLLPLPEYETLDAGLERICVLTRQRQGVACRLSVSGSGARKFNATAANHLLYIAREAIANAVRHGNARHIEVALRQDGEHGLLSIEDDGTGFDPGTERATGAGLRIMGYRADMLGGRLAVRRRVSGGTAVVCTFDPAVISGIAESPPPQFAGMKAATAVQEKEKANDGAQ